MITIPLKNEIASTMSWSPDSQQIACGTSDGEVHIWNVETGQMLSSLKVGDDEIVDVEWSPTSNQLATILAHPDHESTIQVWDVAGGNPPITFELGFSEIRLAWSPDRSQLAGGSVYAVTNVWNASTGQITAHLPFRYALGTTVFDLAWSPDGKQLASSVGYATLIYDVAKQQETFLLAKFDPFLEMSEVSLQENSESLGISYQIVEYDFGNYETLAWSPNGNWLATGVTEPQSAIIIWETSMWLERSILEHDDILLSVQWSPNGRYLASLDEAGDLRQWESELFMVAEE